MPFELTITLKPGYLHASVRGENSPETIRGYMTQVRAACQQHGCLNVLVEENLSGPSLQAFDVFDVVARGSRQVAQTLGRIAFVDTNPEHESRLMQFAETVAVNRGVNMRVFATVPDAERWLASAAAPA